VDAVLGEKALGFEIERLGREPLGDESFRERRTLIRQMRLVADEQNVGVGCLGAQDLYRADAGRSGADDDEPRAGHPRADPFRPLNADARIRTRPADC